ncbi:MAG: hypothetical protein HY053_05955 [Proteobacteria bacterium]|nr:hypothetical protein [Pseudomonadota bacterium]
MPAAATANQPYPNLADVPLRPRPYVLPAQRVDEVKNLKRENAEGQGVIAEFNDETKNTPQPPASGQKP